MSASLVAAVREQLRMSASSSAKNSLTPAAATRPGAGTQPGAAAAGVPAGRSKVTGRSAQLHDQFSAIGGESPLHLVDTLQLDSDLGVGAGPDRHHLAQPGRASRDAGRQVFPRPWLDVERRDGHADAEPAALEHMSEDMGRV